MTIYIHFFWLEKLTKYCKYVYVHLYGNECPFFYFKRGFNEGVNCYNQWVFGLVLHIFREKNFFRNSLKNKNPGLLFYL